MLAHPATELFPMMSETELAELAKDIRENGLQVPITTYQGMILDGRNRAKACEMAGVQPRYQEWQGEGSPTAWVISLNLHRRHLTQSQKACIALDAEALFAEEARKRQGARTDLFAQMQKSEPIHAVNQAAKQFKVSPRYVSDAKKLQQEAPELFYAVRQGDKTITQAKRELVRQQAKEAPPLPSSKYRVIYADPPWSYGNTQPDYHAEQRDHYPVMSIAELCAMPVREIAEDNAVLFLWVTSPILEESFEIIKAWGFKYKASFVWDKVKHNMGHYNSVRHELLLIATRGSCQPDVPKLIDSVVSIERTEHSKKPGEFREIIDMLYVYGRRIELFARERVPNWDAYGNEVSAALSRR